MIMTWPTTGLSKPFRKMRERKLIEMGCEGDCLCGPDPYMDEDGGYDEQ